MWLQNLKVRVKKYPQGYSVEVEKTKTVFLFFKKRYWIHIESYSGLSERPFYYSTKEMAISEATKHFEWDLLISAKYE